MAWTAIDNNTSWQSLSVTQEIAVAYNKRADVVGADSIETELGVASIDKNVAVRDFVYACQNGIENMAISFADNTASITCDSSFMTNFASVADMMTVAGLTQSGYWRRIANNGVNPVNWTNYNEAGWSYDKINAKDEAGPWLFVDIENALDAMTRVLFSYTSPTMTIDTYNSVYHYHNDYGWVSYPPGNIDDYRPYPQNTNYIIDRHAIYQYYKYGLNEACAFSAGVYCGYAKPSITGLKSYSKDVNFCVIPTNNGGYTFDDWGLDLTENQTSVLQVWNNTASTSLTLSVLNGELTSLQDVYYKNPTPSDGLYLSYGLRADDGLWIIDYDFD